MGKSLDKVLQSDGSYKWEMVEFQPELTETKTVKRKFQKRKLLAHYLTNNSWQSKKK